MNITGYVCIWKMYTLDMLSRFPFDLSQRVCLIFVRVFCIFHSHNVMFNAFYNRMYVYMYYKVWFIDFFFFFV